MYLLIYDCMKFVRLVTQPKLKKNVQILAFMWKNI